MQGMSIAFSPEDAPAFLLYFGGVAVEFI